MTWKATSIVAAVDGSDQAVHAAQHAVDLARLSGGSVTLLTVVRPPEGWWGVEGSPPSPEVFAQAVAEGRTEILDRVAAQLDAEGVTINTVEEVGDPSSVIINTCESVGADLVVVGRRGSGLVERMMIGSVADRLAHHAPCPVLIVP